MITFIEIKKIVKSQDGYKTEPETIRADKIESFREFKKNNEHPMAKVEGNIIKVIMKSLSTAAGVHEVYVAEEISSFRNRLNSIGISVIQ